MKTWAFEVWEAGNSSSYGESLDTFSVDAVDEDGKGEHAQK